MHFDIIEAVRQKQHKEVRSISIENGKVVVRPEISPGLAPEEEIEPAQTAPADD